jgi:outer membrane protein assembly factor BamB
VANQFDFASARIQKWNWVGCVLLLSLLSFQSLAAQQPTELSWEFLRGQNLDGHSLENGLADSWPPAGPPLLWTRKLGQGYSSFVGRGDRIYSQYQRLTSQYVICLNATTGETIWEHACDWPYQTVGLYPGPRSTPTLSGDKLYFTTPAGILGCLNQSDGQTVWQINLFEKFQTEPPAFGYASSPVIVDDKLFLPVGGPQSAVVAFHKQDGSVIWQAGDYQISYTSILPIQYADRQIVVAYLTNRLVLFDQQTGKVLAEATTSSGYDEHCAWPVYAEPHLWISAPFRQGSRLFKLTGDDPIELVHVWGSSVMSNDVCSSVLVDDHLYGFDIHDVQSKAHRPSRGLFRCIEFATGRKIWENGSLAERRELDPARTLVASDSVGQCSVIYADGKLILFSDTGELILLAATENRFQQLARIHVMRGEICWTQPMLLNRHLYLRNQSTVACLYLGEQETLAESNMSTLRVADIPQPAHFDLAALVFSVEPEYAMDAPSTRWLLHWYFSMLIAGWAVAFPFAAMTTTIVTHFFRVGGGPVLRRILFRSISIILGVLGTTFLSRWADDFYFTWPLVLAMVFETLVFQTSLSRRTNSGDESQASAPYWNNRWSGRLLAVAFVMICLIYFLACRRLNLATEWSFLVGFPAAVPFLLLARSSALKQNRYTWLSEWVLTAVAFTAYYWLGAGVILWKY